MMASEDNFFLLSALYCFQLDILPFETLFTFTIIFFFHKASKKLKLSITKQKKEDLDILVS